MTQKDYDEVVRRGIRQMEEEYRRQQQIPMPGDDAEAPDANA